MKKVAKKRRQNRAWSIPIKVLQGDWRNIKLNEIAALLQYTASHINQLLRSPMKRKIKVVYDESGPEHFALGSEHLIKLSVQGSYGCQFVYQFSHEFCHAIINPEDRWTPIGNSRMRIFRENHWFEESICQLASVFTLIRMTETWIKRSPLPEWSGYAAKIKVYWQNLLNNPDAQLSDNETLNSWLCVHENKLRHEDYTTSLQRNNQKLIAYQLLPLFEKNPIQGWNAIRELPNSSEKFENYLIKWYSAVNSSDKTFVRKITNTFGYTIDFTR